MDIQPVPGKHPTIKRDHEYERSGTVSLLAGIDLYTGKIIPAVRERHRSCEFIELLTEIDKSYPDDRKIRLILDNHSSHVSKETDRIYQGIDEINREPVIFRWKYKIKEEENGRE